MGDVVHFASDQLVFRPAEQSLSRAIHGDNETLPIHRIEPFTKLLKIASWYCKAWRSRSRL